MTRATAEAPTAITEDAQHRPVRIWQERPGEVSWACSCGTVYKHQPLGEMLYRCDEQMDTARAETTTATAQEAIEVIRAVVYDPANADDWHALWPKIALALVARGLLVAARTRPTREQVIDLLREHDPENHGGQDVAAWYYEAQADAVLALWADQPDPADVWDQALAARAAWEQNQMYYVEDEVPNPYRRG